MEDIRLIKGDCLEEMDKLIEEGVKVDLILTDLPYGITNNKWDSIIDLHEMWKSIELISNDRTCSLMFSDSKFTCLIRNSNNNYRYDLIWDKVLKSGFLNCNKMPLRSHEIINVFYKKLPIYNPQRYTGKKNNSKGVGRKQNNNNYSKFNFIDNENDLKYPSSILTFCKVHPSKTVHPTQKPVDLLEYLIKTYSNPGDTVLDFTMGSGSTGVACQNTGRKFIGIELDEEYFEIAKKRIDEVK